MNSGHLFIIGLAIGLVYGYKYLKKKTVDTIRNSSSATDEYKTLYEDALKSGDKIKALELGRTYYLMKRMDEQLNDIRFRRVPRNSNEAEAEDELKIQNDILAMNLSKSVVGGQQGLIRVQSVNLSQEFIGEMNIKKEAFVLYLIEKYHIIKVDILNKFSCMSKIFETVDEAILFAADEELKSNKY